MAARKKRKGTIALSAAHTLTLLALEMTDPQQKVLVDYVYRWLDNGHNLDAADLEWLAAVARVHAYVNTADAD